MTHTKNKVNRKALRKERLQKSYVDIVDEEHKDVSNGEEITVLEKIEEKVENVVEEKMEKKTKRKYKKKEVKKD